MKDYIGRLFVWYNMEWTETLEADGIKIEDGTLGIITSLDCSIDDDFESSYWGIKLETGETFSAMSGYHLDV